MTSASLRSRPAGFAVGSSSPSLIQRARRVVEYRRILKLLVARDLKIRYAGSALGYFWSVLEPLLMSLVYWFVFTKVFHRDAGSDYTPYMLYLITGQLPWFMFNGGVQSVTRALRSEAQMVRSTNVPRELWVLRAVISKFVEYLLGLPVIVIFAVCYLVAPRWETLLLPLGWLIEIVLLIGVGLILAPLAVLVRDIERVVPIIMRVFFYGSPILYSVQQAPAALRTIYTFNPTVGFLQIARAPFFPAALYERKTVTRRDSAGLIVSQHVHTINHWNWVWHSALAAVVVLLIGGVVFMRLERHVLKEI